MMNIKTTTFIFSTLLLSAFLSSSCNAQEKGLKDVAQGKFLIGAAVNVNQVKGKDPKCIELLDKHFNSIVAENCMKSEEIHPQENVYNFTEADEFVNFGRKHNMTQKSYQDRQMTFKHVCVSLRTSFSLMITIRQNLEKR